MKKHELTCIGCPLGCNILVTTENGAVTEVTGNTCKRGDAYARKEVTYPTRVVTTSVKVSGGTSPMVSCKTKEDIPKDKVFDCVRALRDLVVPAPITIGDVLLADVAGTGVPIVATKNVASKQLL